MNILVSGVHTDYLVLGCLGLDRDGQELSEKAKFPLFGLFGGSWEVAAPSTKREKATSAMGS